MAFGQDFLKGFFGANGLRDYTHASKTFRTNGYEFAPRNKFLFHVYFSINTSIPAVQAVFGKDISTIGLMVKNIQLPSYGIKVDTMNQYNRKRLVQSKIDYNPVSVEFHDDGGDLVRNMWYNYFAYYYKDPTQKYDSVANQNGSMGALIGNSNGFDYNSRDTYTPNRSVNDWGYVGEAYSDGSDAGGSTTSKPPFFRDIRIYGLDQHKFAEYVLVNPLISEWAHDSYDYSQGNGTMSNRMTIRYETVKYYSGAGVGIVEDLQSGGVAGYIGAIQKAGATYNTFKGKDIKSIAITEAKQAATTVLKQELPGAVRGAIGTTARPGLPAQRGSLDGLFFPTPPRNAQQGSPPASPTGNYTPGRPPAGVVI